MMAIGGHHLPVMGKDEWLTPPNIIKALGPFDLDPCAPIVRPWDTAKDHYNILDDGLTKTWFGTVWCNPPYGKEARQWLDACSVHKEAIALIFARTETEMFFSQVWKKAVGLLFIEGRLHFHHVSGERAKSNSGGPSVLVAYSEECLKRLLCSRIPGKLIRL